MTLNQKTVAKENGQLVTKNGFHKRRAVVVLLEELYYDDDFESFKVVHLNFPLEGKVPLEYVQKMQKAVGSNVPLERRSVSAHGKALAEAIGESASTDLHANVCSSPCSLRVSLTRFSIAGVGWSACTSVH